MKNTISIDIIKNLIKKKLLYHFDNSKYKINHSIDDSYWVDFDYCYEVKCKNLFLGQSDYSPLVCNSELKNKFKNLNEESPIIIEFVDLFAKSYIGDIEAKKKLRDYYNFDISNKEEYVTDLPVKVKKIYIEEEDTNEKHIN